MRKIFTCMLALCMASVVLAQTYKETDVNVLKAILTQDSNASCVGLSKGWETTDDWAGSVKGVEWTTTSPKEIKSIEWESGELSGKLKGALKISGLASLTTLDCIYNAFESISITDCPKLTSIYCGENYVGENFELKNCPAVMELACDEMGLTSLDLSGFPELTALACRENDELASLDLSKTPKLMGLDCHSCALTTLDVSNCPDLSILYCQDNHLLFSQLPVPGTIEEYVYAPQYINYGETGGIVVNPGELIDLSAYLHNNKTTFEWYKYIAGEDYEEIVDLNGDGKIDSSDTVEMEEVEGGKFAIPEWAYGSHLACAMSNGDFPDFKGDDRLGVSIEIKASSTGNAGINETNPIQYINGVLSISHPSAELISVYSLRGELLYSAHKGEGVASFDLSHLPNTLLIIRGSTGWVKKVLH